jgi:large subunit ribosomal protein L29
MKKEVEELKKLSADELKARISETEETLLKLKFSHAVAPIENPMLIRNTRRQIARMKTVLTMLEKSNNK